jgi:acyl-CoA thioester hydrolase
LNQTDAAITWGHVWPVRVYYEDTDAGGVVYYANYLRFLERARTEWLRALGLGQAQIAAETGLLFVVRRVTVDYLLPGRLDDLLEIRSRITEMRRTSMAFAQEVIRVADGVADAVTLVRAETLVVCMDGGTARPRAIPPEMARHFHG